MQTNKWLKENGLSEKSFTAMDLLFVQAQQIAHNLLKHNAALLDNVQAKQLNDYLTKANNKAKQKTLTTKQAHAVMKIGKRINRQLFKAYKTTNSR